jgi:fermentation-respiration switch protein FrsA (DUF1100 family)
MLSLDKSVFCCRFPRMGMRFFPILLASASLVAAQEPRIRLDDPNGEVSRIARTLLGEGGGNQLFYLPTRDEPANPASWGCKYENIFFKSADGTPLHGWFIPAKGKSPHGTVVFSHGNAGSLGHHLGFVTWLVEAGYNVMMYDYRGFGKSGGVDRRGMVDDVKAAFAHVTKRPGVDPRRLVSYGHSLGGAKSVTALAETPVRGLRAVVIDGAFASYKTMARVIGGQLGESLVTDELAPRDYVGKLSPVPLLVVHGARDEVVPLAQGRLLYQSAGQPKTLFEVKAGRHGDALSANDGQFRKRMLAWLAENLEG